MKSLNSENKSKTTKSTLKLFLKDLVLFDSWITAIYLLLAVLNTYIGLSQESFLNGLWAGLFWMFFVNDQLIHKSHNRLVKSLMELADVQQHAMLKLLKELKDKPSAIIEEASSQEK